MQGDALRETITHEREHLHSNCATDLVVAWSNCITQLRSDWLNPIHVNIAIHAPIILEIIGNCSVRNVYSVALARRHRPRTPRTVARMEHCVERAGSSGLDHGRKRDVL
jgi:hypothetical protein